MRKFSKGISILLAICMIIAMVPAAFAAEATTVTVSMLDSNITTTSINHSGNGAVSSGYTITWKDESAELDYANTKIGYFRMVALDKYYSLASGSYSSVQFVFKTKLAAEGDYAIDITPILTYYGGMYGVWVNDQYAGKVNSWYEGAAKGWTAKEGDKASLNTLHLKPDDDGYVTIKLKNLSTTYDSTGTTADSYKDAYAVPLGFKEITLTPVTGFTCNGLDENISDAELYVGKTLDFVIAPDMSDGSTRYFDTSDANSYITASVADGSSVTITDTVMKEDGLHGKISAVSADAATINVAVTLSGVTTNHTINVTPIAALVPEVRKIIPHDKTLNATLPTSGTYAVDFSTHDIIWQDGKTEVVESKTNISNFRQNKPANLSILGSASLGNYYRWPLGNGVNAQFTMRTKLASGTYAISITPLLSQFGGTYGIWVDGQYAGKVDSWDGKAGTTSGWNSGSTIGTTTALNTLNIMGDSESWVEITLKNLSTADELQKTDLVSIGFMDITLTPVAETAAVSSLSENITSTDIYKGETSDFYIKAVMNDGQIHKFDTSNTADKIEASVPAGSAVKLSDMVMKEDGLYGKITGAGEDESATVTVKTTINGVVDTKTIKAISFERELSTPEKVVVSMSVANSPADVIHNKPDGMNFTSASTLTWGDGSKVRLVKEKTHLTAFREYSLRSKIAYGVITNPVAGTKDSFTFKVRAAAGTYKVDLVYAETVAGCVYDVIIGGTNVGSVDCSGTTTNWYEPSTTTYSADDLSNVTLTPDEDGWVEITLKWKSGGYVSGTNTTACLFFKNITLTPTVKLYAVAETVDGDVDGLVTASGYNPGEIADVAFGEKITLTANNTDDYTFLYWMNNSNNMYLGEEPTYTFDATSNLAISAVYTKSGNTRYDYFTDVGERIATAFGTAPQAPEIPSKIGYDTSAVNWEIKLEHKRADYEAYAPDYSAAVAKTFDVNYDDGNVEYNEEITLTTTDSDFRWWKKGDKVVGYEKTYTFYAWGSETVRAILEGGVLTAAEKKPAVVLFSNGNEHMLELVGFDGIEIVEKGILFAESGKPTIGSTLAKAKSRTDNKQFAAKSDYTVARAYVVYKDGANLKVVYSD